MTKRARNLTTEPWMHGIYPKGPAQGPLKKKTPKRQTRSTTINLFGLLKTYAANSESARKFLESVDAISLNRQCQNCHSSMVLVSKNGRDGVALRCPKRCKGPGTNASIRKNSFFLNSNLSLDQELLLSYFWLQQFEVQQTAKELEISESTVVDHFKHYRSICLDIMLTSKEKIGGPGKIVEIDESKFGRRKYNRGRRVDGQWVFGGVQRSDDHNEPVKGFLVCVGERKASNLIPILKEYVLPGTTIISDYWKAYDKLNEHGFIHQKVNHSLEFVNNQTGAHTNTIESNWYSIKKSIKSGTTKTHYSEYFQEWLWRRRFHGQDLFHVFWKHVGKIYDPLLGYIDPTRSGFIAPLDQTETVVAPIEDLVDSLST